MEMSGAILSDVISPVMLVTGARLLIGNLLIGTIEGMIVFLFFRTRPLRAIGWMIAANYFSALVGVVLLAVIGVSLGTLAFGHAPLYHVRRFLWVIFFIALLLSFALELPFVLKARGNRSIGLRRALLACGAAQIASYAILLPAFYAVTVANLDRNAHLTESLSFASEKSAKVLFLSSGYRDVYQIGLDGSPARLLQHLGDHDTWLGSLCIYKADAVNQWDLWLTDGRFNRPLQGDQLILKDVAASYPGLSEEDLRGDETIDYRPPTAREWTVSALEGGYSPRHGLRAHNQRTGEDIYLAVDAPFASWNACCATVLPGDQVIFELGGQIALLDLNSRQLAFVAFGSSPVVVLPQETSTR